MNEEIYYHIYNRGIEKMPIFKDERDYERFLESLKLLNTIKNRTIRDYKDSQEQRSDLWDSQRSDLCSVSDKLVEIFCFCLMPNHFHLILRESIEGGIARFMQKLCIGYTMYFNTKYDRSGHLFQGKYKHKEINADFYLTYLTGYIHLNPVAAGLVKFPERYKYSSYLDFLGKRKTEFLDFKPEELEIKIEDYEKFILELKKDKDLAKKLDRVILDEE